MCKFSIHKIEKNCFLFAGILMALVFVMSWGAKNSIETNRTKEGYTVIENAEYEWREKAESPVGREKIYNFTLGKIGHSGTLAFYINHHEIEVYLAEECVYRVKENSKNFITTGGIYVMIPLEEQDAGKEVEVVLAPLYDDYQDNPQFMIGSALAIYKEVLKSAMPELLLSLGTVLAGSFLLALAIYHSIRKNPASRLYAIGMLAVAAGVWRFTYGRVAYLLLADHSVAVYTLSIISLMLIALSMLGCIEMKKERTMIPYIFLIYSIVYIIQLTLQLTGLLDLRQMLAGVHITIIISALGLLLSGVASWIGKKEEHEVKNYSWLLGIGAMVDLRLYYYGKDSVRMLFTLGAILCFSLLEGMQLLIGFTEQKNALEEMEIKLALSRTTTMMSQIRSHFVFNLLNAISGMCKYDPEKADDTVVRFARYLRNNIDIMEEDKNIPFATDLKQLEDYVALEQVRFGDKIEFYTDIETEDFLIPPLILQPVIENAIKHGISKKQGNGTIILKTREQGENIIITIEDDGIGFDRKELEKEKSVGLKNIQFRLEHLVNGTFSIFSKVKEGTVVTITIPKNNTSNIPKTGK